MRIVFYNVENLFDPADDTLKSDESFTPEGDYHWSEYKYWQKQHKIAQVISATGGWEVPDIVGLCEVENIHVLINLVRNTSLERYKYSIVHHESPDRRGIDVALIYRGEKFRLLHDTAYQINFPFDPDSRTRDLLYVKGVGLDLDTLHIFVSHWPSKYGGAFVTIPKRKYVAAQIRDFALAIQQTNPEAKILIMGDFNDVPGEESVSQSLQAKSPSDYQSGDLVNLMLPLSQQKGGTHFYAGNTGNEWSVLDQMVVSSPLLDSHSGLVVKNRQAHIFAADFLFETNSAGLVVPFRTFIGMKYNGGFSDHLPVYLDLSKVKN
jgi:predicted extracellular nuclease